MLSCEEISRLVSESLDRKIPLYRRIEVWLHLKMCRLCSGFKENLLQIRAIAKESEQGDEPAPDELEGLSAESKERMRRIVTEELSGERGA